MEEEDLEEDFDILNILLKKHFEGSPKCFFLLLTCTLIKSFIFRLKQNGMKKVFLLALAINLITAKLTAQQPLKYCGTDEVSWEFYQNHPDLQSLMLANRAELKSFTQNYISSLSGRANPDSLYIIPVVFHVIHTYGTENISDAQIMSGLKVLNWNFRKQNPDTSSIVSAFQSIAADCEIEFRLAHLDPNGNCTSGINRIASPATSIGDHRVKDFIHWDPSKYLNIYVVKSIANLAGHCLMPDQAAAKPEWDGMVVANDYVGDIGTSSDLSSVVLAHEAGHYLNLFHIWGGNNVPYYYYLPVGQASNCNVGDDVDDTPPTQGWGTCNLNAASCGNTVDNVQNAMDYSYCNFMFTQGQRQRMRATLNSTMAGRNNLITAQNLSTTGVNLTSLCKANFNIEQRVACVGDSIQFSDQSIATPDSWLWNFGDGNTSTEQNPKYAYAADGDYTVTLMATKGGTTLTSDPVLVHINYSISGTPYYVQDFETISNIGTSQLFPTTDNGQLVFNLSALSQGYKSTRSAVLRIPDTTVVYAGRTTLISPTINLNNTLLPNFSFRYACTQKMLNSNDQLEVFISNDCGKTWISKGKKNSSSLRTTLSVETDPDWAPLDSTQWKPFTFSIPASYSVSGFMFKIELTNYSGNAYYLDNINVNASAYNGIQKVISDEVDLVPNPSSDLIVLNGLPETMTYQITDVNGNVYSDNQTIRDLQMVDVTQLPTGIYLIKLENETSFCVKRFLKY